MVPEDYDVYIPEPKEIREFFAGSVSVLIFLGYVFYSRLIVSVVLSLLSFVGYRYYIKSRVHRRKNELMIQFKDMLYSVSASVNAGRHLGEALADSEDTLIMIYGYDCLMAREIRHMKLKMSEVNCSEEMVLMDLSDRTHISEIADFAEVCIMCRKTGGDLAGVIYRAAENLCEKIDLKRERDVLMSQKKLESRILAVMPSVVICIIRFTSSGYIDVMYDTPEGLIAMSAAFAANIFSFVWCIRLTDGERFMDI